MKESRQVQQHKILSALTKKNIDVEAKLLMSCKAISYFVKSQVQKDTVLCIMEAK